MFEVHSDPEACNIQEASHKETAMAPPLTPKREQLLFSKINLNGTKDWNDDFKHPIKASLIFFIQFPF